jgi:hypothetical protein
LLGIQNARKARTGMLQGLQDPNFIERKREAEARLLEQVKGDADLKKYAAAWEAIEKLCQREAKLQGKGISLNTSLFRTAQTLVRMAAEDQKPSAERLREYRDSARDSLLQQLFSPAPVYKDLEQAKLADLIAFLMEMRGGNDPLVKKILDGQSPQTRASQLVQGTQLDDVAFRRQLAEGGADAIGNCKDPMIQLALLVDPPSRELRKIEDEIEEERRQAYAQIAEALFATQGTSTYPDATFTLRLAFGTVKGYQENGAEIPPWTTFAGAFEHEKAHEAKDPWLLPKSWHDRKDDLKPNTQFDFVCTADIIGGNSGSPVVNRDLELVGLIFDGNLQSLTGDYYFSDVQDRAISVSSQAIRVALRDIYRAKRIVDELGH